LGASETFQRWEAIARMVRGAAVLAKPQMRPALSFAIMLAVFTAACGTSDDGNAQNSAPDGQFVDALISAAERVCREEVPCDGDAVSVVGAWIDSDTRRIPDAARKVIEESIGRRVVWLESLIAVDAQIAELDGTVIITFAEPRLFDGYSEVDVGWSRGLGEGKMSTILVDQGSDQLDAVTVTTVKP